MTFEEQLAEKAQKKKMEKINNIMIDDELLESHETSLEKTLNFDLTKYQIDEIKEALGRNLLLDAIESTLSEKIDSDKRVQIMNSFEDIMEYFSKDKIFVDMRKHVNVNLNEDTSLSVDQYREFKESRIYNDYAEVLERLYEGKSEDKFENTFKKLADNLIEKGLSLTEDVTKELQAITHHVYLAKELFETYSYAFKSDAKKKEFLAKFDKTIEDII